MAKLQLEKNIFIREKCVFTDYLFGVDFKPAHQQLQKTFPC